MESSIRVALGNIDGESCNTAFYNLNVINHILYAFDVMCHINHLVDFITNISNYEIILISIAFSISDLIYKSPMRVGGWTNGNEKTTHRRD